MNSNPSCPVCGYAKASVNPDPTRDAVNVRCDRCGDYSMSGSVVATLPDKLSVKPQLRLPLSAYLYRHQNVMLTSDAIARVEKDYRPLSPAEQANALILYMSGELADPGKSIELDPELLQAPLVAVSHYNVNYVVKSLLNEGLLEGIWRPFENATHTFSDAIGMFHGILTFKGWRLAEELTKSTTQSTTAFMAMKFGDEQLDRFINDHVRPAVAATGYKLIRVDDEPRAGLIDDTMRVAIRSSKFLVADLSHGNKGAYWEAGFAEGLGKPVIYLCRKDVFHDPANTNRPHFDTNHHLTVVWDPDDPMEAVKQLKATIRYSLPEAKQTD